MYRIVGSLLALIVGLLAVEADTVWKKYTLSEAQVAEVQDTVRKMLKDPDSAKFGSMIATTDGGKVVSVCGWVNAKNSLGGYTGQNLFTGDFLGAMPFEVVGFGFNGEEFARAKGRCYGRGMDLN